MQYIYPTPVFDFEKGFVRQIPFEDHKEIPPQALGVWLSPSPRSAREMMWQGGQGDKTHLFLESWKCFWSCITTLLRHRGLMVLWRTARGSDSCSVKWWFAPHKRNLIRPSYELRICPGDLQRSLLWFPKTDCTLKEFLQSQKSLELLSQAESPPGEGEILILFAYLHTDNHISVSSKHWAGGCLTWSIPLTPIRWSCNKNS